MIMDIKATNEKHTVTWLKSQDSAGKLNKNISIQCREVWDAEKKQLDCFSSLSYTLGITFAGRKRP